MYGFKLINGERILRAQFDGYSVGDLALIDIMIQIEFDSHHKIHAFFTPEDALKLKNMNSEPWLLAAKQICEQALQARDFTPFITSLPIKDITNEQNQSYYQEDIHHSKPLLKHKEVLKLNIQSIFLNASVGR